MSDLDFGSGIGLSTRSTDSPPFDFCHFSSIVIHRKPSVGALQIPDVLRALGLLPLTSALQIPATCPWLASAHIIPASAHIIPQR